MVYSYFKTGARNILRNKLFSFINIAGLAISMSVALIVIAFIADLLSYDTFHTKRSRIYRVMTTFQREGQEQPMDLASTSVRAGKAIQESVSGVQETVILRRGFRGDAHYNDNYIPTNGLWASENLFKVFDFEMIAGDPTTALREPHSIVLTEDIAKKIFGNSQALGKTIVFDTVAYEVTGVLKKLPAFSHIKFETLVSFSTLETTNQQFPDFLKWDNVWMNYVYLLLPDKSASDALQQSLIKISEIENKTTPRAKVKLSLQPLSDIALGKNLSNQIGPTMDPLVVYVLSGLAIVVILSACFNYTNLSVARSLRRSREIGIRKVNGAQKRHIVYQFISEAILISLMALLLSIGLFVLLRPQFLSLAPEWYNLVTLDLRFQTVLYFILLATAVGVLAGALPAIVFSKVNPASVLRNGSNTRLFKKLTLRKALIFVQYSVSLIFIATTIIGYKQYKHFLNFNLGFETENVMNIRLEGNDPDVVLKQLAEIPEITATSKSEMVTSVGSYYGSLVKYNNPNDSAVLFYNGIDENYLPLHGHKLLAGRNIKFKAESVGESEVLVNEQVLKRFDIGGRRPENAIGEEITVDGKKLTIVGVLKDFHYGKVDSEIVPVFFRYYDDKEHRGYLNVKVSSKDMLATMSKIESAWKSIDKIHPLDAKFYDEQIERAYSEISAMVKMIAVLAILAISIASLGLLGMVVFTTETRLKEISVRKVLGASDGSLVFLLGRGFLILLTTAALIALPVTYFLFDKVFLVAVAYKAPISLVDLLAGFVVVLAIALIMIGSQTLKVTRSNPATILKGE